MNLHVNLHATRAGKADPPESLAFKGVVTVGPDGFEPSPPVPKTGVLPLDDGP